MSHGLTGRLAHHDAGTSGMQAGTSNLLKGDTMRFTTFLLAGTLLAAAVPALAQDATDPPKAITISGGATLVSDYRFRGISQTAKKFAIQGTFTVAHESGFYATVWGSSVDDYIANGGDAEIDLIAGYKKTFGGTTIDGGFLYYYYPGSGGINSDFAEPYISLSHTVGPATAKITANYAFKQHGDYSGRPGRTRDDNLYLAGDLSAGIPNTPISVAAHVGHSFGPSYQTAPYRGYTDWNVGASYLYKNLTFGVSYVDASKNIFATSSSGATKNISKAGVVGSVGVAF